MSSFYTYCLSIYALPLPDCCYLSPQFLLFLLYFHHFCFYLLLIVYKFLCCSLFSCLSSLFFHSSHLHQLSSLQFQFTTPFPVPCFFCFLPILMCTYRVCVCHCSLMIAPELLFGCSFGLFDVGGVPGSHPSRACPFSGDSSLHHFYI